MLKYNKYALLCLEKYKELLLKLKKYGKMQLF